MSGLSGTESRATSSFLLQTMAGATLASAGGAAISNNFSIDELRRLLVRINSYTSPTAPVKIRCTIFSAGTVTSTLQIPNISAELIFPPTGASPNARFCDFIFLNSDIIWNGQTMPHSVQEYTLYNNANITPVDANGNTVTINNCFYRSTQVAGRLVGKFRVLLQNMDPANALTFTSANILAVK